MGRVIVPFSAPASDVLDPRWVSLLTTPLTPARQANRPNGQSTPASGSTADNPDPEWNQIG